MEAHLAGLGCFFVVKDINIVPHHVLLTIHGDSAGVPQAPDSVEPAVLPQPAASDNRPADNIPQLDSHITPASSCLSSPEQGPVIPPPYSYWKLKLETGNWKLESPVYCLPCTCVLTYTWGGGRRWIDHHLSCS